MSGISYQEAVSRINRCIAEIKEASMDNNDPGEWLQVAYLTYELEKTIKKIITEAQHGKQSDYCPAASCH